MTEIRELDRPVAASGGEEFIQVTPAMIEAGVRALTCFDLSSDYDGSEVVSSVLSSALGARMRKALPINVPQDF